MDHLFDKYDILDSETIDKFEIFRLIKTVFLLDDMINYKKFKKKLSKKVNFIK